MPAALAGIVETDGITALYRFKSNCHLTIRITCAPILLFAGVFSMAYARAGRLLDSVLNRTCDLAFTSWTGGHAELLCAPYRPLRLADLFDFDFIALDRDAALRHVIDEEVAKTGGQPPRQDLDGELRECASFCSSRPRRNDSAA